MIGLPLIGSVTWLINFLSEALPDWFTIVWSMPWLLHFLSKWHDCITFYQKVHFISDVLLVLIGSKLFARVISSWQNSGLARIELISGMHVIIYSASKELTTVCEKRTSCSLTPAFLLHLIIRLIIKKIYSLLTENDYGGANLINVNKSCYYTLGNKVEIWKIKATGSADRDFLVIYSGHG